MGRSGAVLPIKVQVEEVEAQDADGHKPDGAFRDASRKGGIKRSSKRQS